MEEGRKCVDPPLPVGLVDKRCVPHGSGVDMDYRRGIGFNPLLVDILGCLKRDPEDFLNVNFKRRTRRLTERVIWGDEKDNYEY